VVGPGSRLVVPHGTLNYAYLTFSCHLPPLLHRPLPAATLPPLFLFPRYIQLNTAHRVDIRMDMERPPPRADSSIPVRCDLYGLLTAYYRTFVFFTLPDRGRPVYHLYTAAPHTGYSRAEITLRRGLTFGRLIFAWWRTFRRDGRSPPHTYLDHAGRRSCHRDKFGRPGCYTSPALHTGDHTDTPYNTHTQPLHPHTPAATACWPTTTTPHTPAHLPGFCLITTTNHLNSQLVLHGLLFHGGTDGTYGSPPTYTTTGWDVKLGRLKDGFPLPPPTPPSRLVTVAFPLH